MKFFRTAVCYTLCGDFGRVESRTRWWEAKKMQIKLATKMTWKSFEETVRSG